MEKLIAGVVRYTSATGWYLQNDANHAPIGLSSVGIINGMLRLNYNFTASKVGALSMSPDNILARKGYAVAGAGVGKTAADFELTRDIDIYGQVSFSDGAWVISYQNENYPLSVIDMGGGVIRICHESISPGNLPPMLTPRIGGVESKIGLFTTTYFDIHFSAIALTSECLAIFRRGGQVVVDPSMGYPYPDGNYFVSGVMSV